MQDKKCNDSASIVTQVLEEMKQEQGEKIALESVNKCSNNRLIFQFVLLVLSH